MPRPFCCSVRDPVIGHNQLYYRCQPTVDTDGFYAARRPSPAPASDLLVLSFDGKGIVMRPDALRETTARAYGHKLATRLSLGEKCASADGRIGAVYDATPMPGAAGDIVSSPGGRRAGAVRPDDKGGTAGRWPAGSG